MDSFFVEDKNYTISEIHEYNENGLSISLSDPVIEKIQASRNILTKVMDSGKAIYGVNTGFGKLSQVKISDSQLTLLQKNLLLSHSAGVGPAGGSEALHEAIPGVQSVEITFDLVVAHRLGLFRV